MSRTVLILGANGKIGSHAAEAFWNAGWTVRRYVRGTDMTEAAAGCSVIVNGLNPPNYERWEATIPAITTQVIAAAKASGARVILPGNVYNFGATPGEWSEDTPQTASTKKGRVRIEMERAYRDAGVPVIVLRAGNFIDPLGNGDVMRLVVLSAAKRGKITCAGGPDVMQAYCYLPDWARAAVALAEVEDRLAPFEDIPFPGHAFTLSELRAGLEAETGRPFRFKPFPWWLMTLLSPVWPLARELREMRYLWNTDHWLSGAKFHRLLPDFRPTDLRQVMLAGLPDDIHPDKAMRTGGQTIAAE